MKRKSLVVSLICLMMSIAMAGSLGAKSYKYQDLTLQGLWLNPGNPDYDSINAINDSGWIVGSFNQLGPVISIIHPFVWRPGLGKTTLLWGEDGYANGINNAGKIVGDYMGLSPCLWTDPSQGPTYLYGWTNGGHAAGINDGGQIAGDMVFGSSGVYIHAARWDLPQQAAADLGTLGGNTSSGKCINNAKWVAGVADTTALQSHACLWEPGQPPKDLVTLPAGGYFSSANAINNQGNVVGKADLTPGLGTGHGFYWDHQTGVAHNICPQDYESNALGISEANEVVGYVTPNPSKSQLFFWTPSGGQKDLKKLVVNLPAGVTLWTAAISPNGRYITGFASNGHPYLLTAIRRLSSLNLLLLD